ncbi:MAG TPA: hypothetical protein VJ385_07065 [Fibrobacteria bacterium]|nr:hypothetical protein [Fibrobacteria bacterium]
MQVKIPINGFGSEAPDRLSASNPGPAIPGGPIRGVLLMMLEQMPIEEIRSFWRSHVITIDGKKLLEGELYRHLWENKDGLRQYHVEMIYSSLQYFLWCRGRSIESFITERFYRLEQGGIWKSSEHIAWSKDFLPQLYKDPDPMLTLEKALCHYCTRAVPGSDCRIAYLKVDEGWIESVFSFAFDAQFHFRNLFLFSHISLVGARIFPGLFGLPEFEKVRPLADCLHPAHILWGKDWEIKKGRFFIEGDPYGELVRFSEWSRSQSLQFQGINVPERDVILMDRDYLCPLRRSPVLLQNCIYDAPLYLARIGFPRKANFEQFGGATPYMDKILSGLTKDDTEEWQRLGKKYHELLQASSEKLVFEYRALSQALLLNGKTLISGVPAKILWKILVANGQGQSSFDFRAFKYDPEIFADSKRSSFETRWNRLRTKLAEATNRVHMEKIGRGKFAFHAECPIEFQESE